MDGQKCSNCRFWKAKPTDLANGTCRRRVYALPIYQSFNNTLVTQVEGHVPPTNGAFWCGEWEPKNQLLGVDDVNETASEET